MSVALDAAENLPKPRLPRSLGGEGRDPVFRAFSKPFPLTLVVREDGYPHANVEPRIRCSLDQFESDLTATRRLWSKTNE